MKLRFRWHSAAIALAAAFGFHSAASAQATRTWVSGVGDDANPCSRTAPCRTFAGAISKTAASGEINCLDPGGFGAVTITKSISIICDETLGGVLVSGTNGIVVNVAATDFVLLSGLDIHGATTGLSGIRFIGAGTLHVQNSLIQRFNSTNGTGITFAPTGAAQLTVTDTVIADNGSAAQSGGILIAPSGAGTVRATIERTSLQNNLGFNMRVETAASSSTGVQVVFENSQTSGSTIGIAVVTGAGPAGIVNVNDSIIAHASSIGLLANGGNALMRVGDTTITGNATGLQTANGGAVRSWGDNRLEGNGANGAFTPPTLTKS